MESRKLKDTLFEYGIDTYLMSILTTVPTAADSQIPIAKQIPQQVGLIYGLGIYTDGFTPANQPLITSTDAENIFLTFKDGPTEFFQPLRLDALIFKSSGFPLTSAEQYFPVNIQGNFDLSTSFYANPTGVVSTDEEVKVIMLNLWYISTESYLYLIDKKVVNEDAKRFLRGKRK